MYKHILVPIDDTAVSGANVQSALELARGFKAKVTFFYATPDWGATAEGARLREEDSRMFAEAALGETNALLAKALMSAKAAGVEAHAEHRTSDCPAQAILDAVRDLHCDLIVMASRGATRKALNGRLDPSQTERVLHHAPVPLLVTRVAAAHPIENAERALNIMYDEHRSIAVVAQGMRDLVKEALTRGVAADRASLQRMVAYLDEFPRRMHHPKEEQYLHPVMRLRAPQCEEMLADLEAQHEAEGALIDRVAASIALAGGPESVPALSEAVNQLARHLLQHIAHEERVVMPLARQVLRPEDWGEIAEAFSDNEDPRFGDLPAEEFRRMFTRIANVVADDKPPVRVA